MPEFVESLIREEEREAYRGIQESAGRVKRFIAKLDY
jgi:hypothetical protein